jgi:hypothetical protein
VSIRIYLTFILYLISGPAAHAGSDIYFSHTNSSTSKSNKIKAGIEIFPEHKITAIYSKTVSDPSENLADPNSSQLKIGYRYKYTPDTSFSINVKKNDDSYFFEGQSFSAQINQKFLSFELESSNDQEPSIPDMGYHLNLNKKSTRKFNKKTTMLPPFQSI